MADILQCFIDDRTKAILARYAAETGRTITDLAESAIAEAALAADRSAPSRGGSHEENNEGDRLDDSGLPGGDCPAMAPPSR